MRTLKPWRLASLLSGLSLLTLLVVGLPGCGGDSNKSGDLKVGFIYVGAKTDYGYNQAHAEGAAAVEKMKGVKVVEEENVPETDKVAQAMESMIEDGAKVIFPTSYNYYPFIHDLAKKYPEVEFLHCGGKYEPKKHSKNVGTYFGYIYECQYLSGIIAGHTTKTKRLGFVAAKGIPQVLLNINAFTLGARSVDPSIKVYVAFTGTWTDSVKEANEVTNLAGNKVDVITCHVDSPKVVVENAKKNNIFICGYHASQKDLAPNLYLTGAEWNWEKVYTDYIKMIKEKKTFPNVIRGGIKEGFVKMSPYNTDVVSKKAIAAAEAVHAKLMDGSFVIFAGRDSPIRDQAGQTKIAKGEKLDPHTRPEDVNTLESMNYLVEGVVGKLKE